MGQPLRPSPRRRFLSLPPGVAVHAVADGCREAVLVFVAGTVGGWGPADLDAWLTSSYRSTIHVVPRATRSMRGAGVDLGGAFETSIVEASGLTRALLASCGGGRAPAFIAQMVELGFVVGAEDERGAIGWVPVDDVAMTLADRVASLLAADFLTRPNDYRAVAVCEECGAVSFEWTACCEHVSEVDARESELVRRDGAPASYASIFPPPES